jgi:hypothetical protein
MTSSHNVHFQFAAARNFATGFGLLDVRNPLERQVYEQTIDFAEN